MRREMAEQQAADQRRPQRAMTLRRDGIRWDVKPTPDHVLAVGDIHGDLAGLACILRDRRLVTKKGRWKGGDTHLVLTGDLVGGPNTYLLLCFVIRVQNEAAAAGGAVHVLLGNHDIRDLPTVKASSLFAGDIELGSWLRDRNTVIRIGRTLFTHAGINTWAFRHHPERVNATVRAWIRYWQGVGRQPDSRTQWVVSGRDDRWERLSNGPLWTGAYKVKKKKKGGGALGPRSASAPDVNQFSRLLRRYKVDRMVVGHAPVADSRVHLAHPYYGSQVIMIDTRMSDLKKGHLSCLEISGTEIQAHYPDRREIGTKIVRREMRRVESSEDTTSS